MSDLLFLSHRIPYPPDKGEKIRAWHILQRLARRHRLHVGCFIDDPADWAHVPMLRAHCADLACFGIDRRWRLLRSLPRLRPGLPLSLAYFQDARLRRFVAKKLAQGMQGAFVYCSAMAPYLMHGGRLPRVLDMVDVDSEKWREYARRAAWPARAVWAREARTLFRFERQAVKAFDRTVLVSAAEAERFLELAPDCAGRVGVIENGVDLARFALGPWADPYPPGGPVVTFVATLDYWPNVDAAVWFAEKILPRLRAACPGVRFAVVGARPADAVRKLAALDGVLVTGRVDDVRPYIAHAACLVAPLRIARGIQNKVLEAMAMAAAVVATPEAFSGIRAQAGRDLLVAGTEAGFADSVADVLAGRHPGLGAAARQAMQAGYDWETTLSALETLFGRREGAQAVPRAVPQPVAP